MIHPRTHPVERPMVDSLMMIYGASFKDIDPVERAVRTAPTCMVFSVVVVVGVDTANINRR